MNVILWTSCACIFVKSSQVKTAKRGEVDARCFDVYKLDQLRLFGSNLSQYLLRRNLRLLAEIGSDIWSLYNA